MRCDAIRQRIEDWKKEGLISDDEYYFLITSLVESIDKYANTASVYGAFLKKLKKTAQNDLVLKPAELIINDRDHKVFNEDINELSEKIKGDILYWIHHIIIGNMRQITICLKPLLNMTIQKSTGKLDYEIIKIKNRFIVQGHKLKKHLKI